MFFFHSILFSIKLMRILIGTLRRNRLPKSGHCDKINFGGCDNGRSIEQPLFIKSKEDGSWTSVQNSAYHFSPVSSMSLASTTPSGTAAAANISTNLFKLNASNNSINSPNLNNSSNNINNVTSSNQIHLSSFGRADNV